MGCPERRNRFKKNPRGDGEGRYQDLLSGKSDAFELLDQVQALEKLGVTEGTLAEI